MRPAIGARRQMKSMPVNRRGLRKRAPHIHLHTLAVVHLKRWAKKWLIDTDCGRFQAFEKAGYTFLQIKIEGPYAVSPLSGIKLWYGKRGLLPCERGKCLTATALGADCETAQCKTASAKRHTAKNGASIDHITFLSRAWKFLQPFPVWTR